MHHKSLVLSAALIATTSSSALAQSLVLEPSSANLVPQSFEYRFDATRRWLGCYSYDFLQGSGWYPKVWHHTAEFTPADGDYELSFQRSFTERYCAAEMGIYNYVSVVWTNPEDPSETYRGVMQIDAKGSTKLDEVTCTLRDATDPWNAIECEQASVNLSTAGAAYVIMNVVGLD